MVISEFVNVFVVVNKLLSLIKYMVKIDGVNDVDEVDLIVVFNEDYFDLDMWLYEMNG